MPSIESLIAFAIAAFILIVIPGPSVLFSVARALELGRLGGSMSVAGNTLASFAVACLVALGIGTIIAQSEVLFNVVKFLGAGYIVYLGVQGIRHRNDRPHTEEASQKWKSNWKVFRAGFIVGATNPKSFVFFVAVLPQFVELGAGNAAQQMLVLAAIFTAIALIVDSSWMLLAAAARDWFARSPGRLDAVRGIGGALLILLGISLLFAQRV